MLKTGKSTLPLMRVIGERVKDHRMERTSSLVTLSVCRNDMLKLIESLFFIEGNEALEIKAILVLMISLFQIG